MGETRHVPLVIVGGGPAGLTAAIYGVRSGIQLEVIERGVPGGQVFIAHRIENYPGFPDGISGPELSDRMKGQAEKLGVKIVQDRVQSVELAGEKKKLYLDGGDALTCDALIVATGSNPNKLGVPGEGKFWGKGVSYCATCDGNFFRGQRVAVVGGGDSACQEAEMLAHLAKDVYIIHRRHQFRAQEYLAQCALAEPNIHVLWDSVLEKIEGDKEVQAITLKNVKTGESTRMELEGVFIYVGMHPITEFLRGVVELTPEGYIKAGEDTKTSVPGIFAAGDVRIKPARQIATAVADGASAVRAVEIYFIERGLSARYV
ncbi:MAG TPA: thioredoxin-disulfide reductase [bacterium]|nr:thioredoxin-disulfide reductase [bacterium]